MSEVRDVLCLLDDLERLTRRHGVCTWADEFRQIRESGADAQELKRRVLDLYRGTMGSLTDLIISRFNGHDVDDEVAANAELGRLVDALWERAHALPPHAAKSSMKHRVVASLLTVVGVALGALSAYGWWFHFSVGPAHGPGLELGVIAGCRQSSRCCGQ